MLAPLGCKFQRSPHPSELKSATTLTSRNAAAVAQYAELGGMMPQEFLSAFLAEFLLNRFADPKTGYAEAMDGLFQDKRRHLKKEKALTLPAPKVRRQSRRST
jgi:hypothetical protein